MRYTVQLANGRTYGPVATDRLVIWAQQRRIPPDAILIPDDRSNAIAVRHMELVWRALQAPPPPGQPAPPGADAPPLPEDHRSFVDHTSAGNPSAIGAFVCGLFALAPVLGLLMGPIAVLLWFQSRKLLRRQLTVKGRALALIGLVLGVVGLLGNFGWFIAVVAGVASMPTF